jgi:hypothetical protein
MRVSKSHLPAAVRQSSYSWRFPSASHPDIGEKGVSSLGQEPKSRRTTQNSRFYEVHRTHCNGRPRGCQCPRDPGSGMENPRSLPVIAPELTCIPNGQVCWSIQVDPLDSPACWCHFLTMLQLLPQIFINYTRHHATGLQPSMMMLWAWAGVPLGVYNIVSDFNIALRIQPQILTALSLITWIQCYHYQRVSSAFHSPQW